MVPAKPSMASLTTPSAGPSGAAPSGPSARTQPRNGATKDTTEHPDSEAGRSITPTQPTTTNPAEGRLTKAHRWNEAKPIEHDASPDCTPWDVKTCSGFTVQPVVGTDGRVVERADYTLVASIGSLRVQEPVRVVSVATCESRRRVRLRHTARAPGHRRGTASSTKHRSRSGADFGLSGRFRGWSLDG